MNASDTPSTRPYLIRALYAWCNDSGLTPYLVVAVDASVQVPREHVKNNEIVLNIGMDATSGLELGNEWLSFKARFSGKSQDIMVPMTHVLAIYAKENGQGMAFPAPTAEELALPATQAKPRLSAVLPVAAPPLPATADDAVLVDPQADAEPQAQATPSEERVVQLVPASKPASPPPAQAPESPEGPTEPEPPRPRPSLTRVK